MIYLVTTQQQLFESTLYKIISIEESIDMINSWGDVIQWDSETSGRDPHICDFLCNQFGDYEGKDQVVVDNTTVDISHYKDILETKTLITVNGAFDCQFAFKHNIVPRHQWDCMVVEQTIFLGYDSKYFHCSLKAIAERRLGIDIDKTVRGEIIWRGLDERVIEYAANDCVHLGKIRDYQLQDIKERGLAIAVDIENSFVAVNAYLMWSGIKLDVDKWKQKIDDNEHKKDEALRQLNNWVVAHSETTKAKDLFREGYYRYESEVMYSTKKIKLPEGAVPNWSKTKEESIEYGCVDRYVYCKIQYPFIEVNRQGDLFGGFDLTPKCTINWNSNQQVCDFMEYLGFNVSTEDRKTGKIKRSCTEKVIKKQTGIADDFLKLYFAYTQKEKDCSTYGMNYIDAINPITGRIHTTFRQIGASSGRMSCGGGSRSHNTDLAKLKHLSADKCGYPQIQNLPSDEITRSSFVAEKGNKWISCDYSAAESRLGADIYNEEAMLNEYIHGSGDIHSLTAKMCFPEELDGIEVKDIKKMRPDLRKKAKGPEFACQFGGGAKAIADTLNISVDEAKQIEANYKQGFKGIYDFKERGSQFVRSHGYVLICKYTGMKLWWEDFEKWKEFENLPEYIQKREYTSDERKEHNMAAAKWDRMSLNSPTQGTCAEIIKLASIYFFNWILKHNYFNKILLCNIVHDEINVECPEEIADTVAKVLPEIMEKAASKLCKKLPIPAEASVGDHWIH